VDFVEYIGENVPSLHHAGPKAEEATQAAGVEVLSEGSRVLPVAKANSAVSRCAAEGDNKTHDHDGDEGDDLD
jgi:hypothetical protein